MGGWWRKRESEPESPEQTIRSKYASFRELLWLNNDCLEILAGVQEDLQYAPASGKVVGDRARILFEKLATIVSTLERLTGDRFPQLAATLHLQQAELETYIAARDELARPPLALWLGEIDRHAEAEVGGKAAALAEIRNKLSLPVPDGYVLTAEAYRQFCGFSLWKEFRDATRNVDLNDLRKLEEISAKLGESVRTRPVPRAIEVAITERARTLNASAPRAVAPPLGETGLETAGHTEAHTAPTATALAVRSSAVGEGGERTFAGQFLSLLNIPINELVDAYREVVAGRFAERALFYRLSAGLPEVENPMAVLFLRLVHARASGIMYTRDPKDPKGEALWITATRGLGLDVAGGRAPADLFVLSRKGCHSLLEQNIVRKEEQITARQGGGLLWQAAPDTVVDEPSLTEPHLRLLADWGIQIENHFGCPQDVEWALDDDGKCWILQSRPLALADTPSVGTKSRVRGDPMLSGGRSIYPGRVSGTAHMVTDSKSLNATPQGAVVFLRKASPEIIEVFPRISGLVAEWGNVTGHAAALLREFKIPSVFQLSGAFDRVHNGDMVSLDAVQPRVYSGSFWPARNFEVTLLDPHRERSNDPVSSRLLTLHLLDPSAFNFRPAGCKSAHDVLRFCHEKAIQAMFALSDNEIEHGLQSPKKLLTPAPINLQVLDLGGGLASTNLPSDQVRVSEIVSRPFQALWRGVTHPGVSWTRAMPASLGDLASVMTTSLTSSTSAMRALGERSYLLVADEYMNLNSRLAYHFTLVDACVSDVPGSNYISFRFAGGGAARQRRNLRACFIESCLAHYGFLVDRRGDLVNAWFKKAPAAEMESHLDILGRLMACTSQLDMYMTSNAVMSWYVQQFLEGNYSFQLRDQSAEVL